jgi:hypothetical protein
MALAWIRVSLRRTGHDCLLRAISAMREAVLRFS